MQNASWKKKILKAPLHPSTPPSFKIITRSPRSSRCSRISMKDTVTALMEPKRGFQPKDRPRFIKRYGQPCSQLPQMFAMTQRAPVVFITLEVGSSVRVGSFPDGKTKDTRLCGQHRLWKEHYAVLTRERVFGKIHILKAFDSPEFKMRFCSVAKRQIHPHKYGLCGRRHVTWREGLSTRLVNGAPGQDSPHSLLGDFLPFT